MELSGKTLSFFIDEAVVFGTCRWFFIDCTGCEKWFSTGGYLAGWYLVEFDYSCDSIFHFIALLSSEIGLKIA